MRQISTKLLVFYQFFAVDWLFFWLGIIISGIFNLVVSLGGNFNYGKWLLGLIFGVISSSTIVYVIFGLKKVYEVKNEIIVSDFKKEIVIPFSNISHIDLPENSSLRRIKILLKEPCEFGNMIIFAPSLFEANDIANRLKSKIDTNYLSL